MIANLRIRLDILAQHYGFTDGKFGLHYQLRHQVWDWIAWKERRNEIQAF